MLNGKDFLIIGAREGGYGESIARACIKAGARVRGTTLNPEDPREQEFFKGLGADLIDIPLRFDSGARKRALSDLARIETRLRDCGVQKLAGIIHTVAGGFARQPAVMKSVGDILKGKQSFRDLATLVKRDVYYVNAGSFEDAATGLDNLIDDRTHLVSLTYRGNMPYFISPTKRYLEGLAARMAAAGRRTLTAALPEAWTQSSQFFTGIEIAVMRNYLADLHGPIEVSEDLEPAYSIMKAKLADIEGFDSLLGELKSFIEDQWHAVTASADQGEVYRMVQDLYGGLRKDGTFPVLRQSVEVISDFVREASATILVKELIAGGRYEPGQVRQIGYEHLNGKTPLGPAVEITGKKTGRTAPGKWVTYERDEIRKTLNMYGENFLFLDRVIMETGELRDGGMGFGAFTVPGPDQNPIMKDHFVGMPLFGGHLQMEAVAQFGTFMILKCLEHRKTIPILTGTEFPDLNTMAPPGERLTMMGIIRLHEKRLLTLEAYIENRYARSKGIIRGMILSERIVKKMMSSF